MSGVRCGRPPSLLSGREDVAILITRWARRHDQLRLGAWRGQDRGRSIGGRADDAAPGVVALEDGPADGCEPRHLRKVVGADIPQLHAALRIDAHRSLAAGWPAQSPEGQRVARSALRDLGAPFGAPVIGIVRALDGKQGGA